MIGILRKAALFGAIAVVSAIANASAPAHAGNGAIDDLYRQRGYGIGGSTFGLGHGGTALAGACADLRFTQAASCGRGYGVYGNGLGYGFGF